MLYLFSSFKPTNSKVYKQLLTNRKIYKKIEKKFNKITEMSQIFILRHPRYLFVILVVDLNPHLKYPYGYSMPH